MSMKKIAMAVAMSLALVGVSVLPAHAAKAGQFCSSSQVGKKTSASNGGTILCKQFPNGSKKTYYKWVKVAKPVVKVPSNKPKPTKPPVVTPPVVTPPVVVVPPVVVPPKTLVGFGDSCSWEMDPREFVGPDGSSVFCAWSGQLTSKTTGEIKYVDRMSMDGNFNGYYNTYGDVPYYISGNTYSKYLFTGFVWADKKYEAICTINGQKYPLGEPKKATYRCGAHNTASYIVPRFTKEGKPTVWLNEICSQNLVGYTALMYVHKDEYRYTTDYSKTVDPSIGTCTKVGFTIYAWR